VFTVIVPFANKAMGRLADKQEDTEQVQDGDNVAGSFVLVVDDDDNTRIGMSSLLKGMGCHVLTASSGNEAISGLRDHLRPPDLIITDFNLGADETGLDVLRNVWTALGLRVPSVIITGSQISALRTVAAEERIPVVQKPVGERLLRELLVREMRRDEESASLR
jgi:CheY-like chemotaxis protein